MAKGDRRRRRGRRRAHAARQSEIRPARVDARRGARVSEHPFSRRVSRIARTPQAYDLAARGDFSRVHELYQLFEKPYDEQPAFEGKYYGLTPTLALSAGGTAHMS